MLSNVPTIRLIQERNRWDFASYHPQYEDTLVSLAASRWTVRRLGDLVQFFKYGAGIPADYTEKGVLFIRAQNIREYGIDLTDRRYVDGTIYDLERYAVKAGDILITRSGVNVGEAAVVTPTLAGSAHGSYSIRLRLADRDVSPDYVALAINAPLVRSQIMALKNRSAQPNINIAELSSLRVPIPPRDLQDRITGVMQAAYATRRDKLAQADALLGSIDDIVLSELGISIPALKDERHFLVNITRLTGGRFDPDLHNTKYTGLISQLQERFGSQLTMLRTLCLPITSGSTPLGSKYVDAGVPFLRVQNIQDDGSVDLSELLHVTYDFAKTIERGSVQDGDLLLVIVGATIGKSAVVSGITSFTVANQAIARIRLRDDAGLSASFLQAFLHSPAGQIQISALKRPVAQGNLNLTETGQILVPVAGVETQDRVAAEISNRRAEAKRLRVEAGRIVAKAKARVERLLLGEEST